LLLLFIATLILLLWLTMTLHIKFWKQNCNVYVKT
jgi:hypothetical protein